MGIHCVIQIYYTMQKILVPTDFSKNSFKAIAYAAEIAKRSRGTVILLHVIEPALNMATMETDSKGERKLKKDSRDLILALQSAAAVYPEVTIVPCLIGGQVIPSILRYAEKEKMDLIIMGTKGASGLKKFFMGSVTAGAISKTKIPILTVPVSYEVEKPDIILFATNQFEKNKKLLEKVIAIPQLFSAALHVVVFRDTDSNDDADLIYNEEQINDYLRFLKETFPEITFKGNLLKGKDFEMTIDSYNNKNEGDMITMITYPKSIFEKVMRKSVTKKMAYHSTTPILAIPAII